MFSLVTLLVLSQTDTMGSMLDKGELVLVEPGKDGKFGAATAMEVIDAPPERVWEVLNKMEEFKDFMPKVLTSEVSKKEGNQFDIHFVIDVPGPDTDYVIHYTRDDAKKTLTGTWQKGDLKGSRWFWKVEAWPGGKTMISQQLAVKNFSSLATSLEDENQTITVGINVSSAIAATKAMKKRCEQPPAPAAAPAK